MTDILVVLALLVGLAVLAALVLSWRRHRSHLPEGLVAVGVLAMVAGMLGWGAWITSHNVDSSVVAVQGGDRCRVTWVDPTDATLRETDVDCSAHDDTPLGPSDDLRIKAHTGLLTGTAVSHEGPTTYGLRFWVPGLGTALALVGLVLVQRRARG